MSRTNETFAIILTPEDAAVQTILFLLLLFSGVLGNGSICFFVFRFKSLRTIPNILLTNLATVDLLNIIISPPLLILTLIYDVKELRTKAAALWITLVTILFMQLNLASILVLVVDRFFALAHPIRYILWRSHSKSFCAICAVWIWSLFITGIFFIPLHDIELGGKSLRYYTTAYLTGIFFKKYVLPAYSIVVSVTIIVSSLTLREILKKRLRKRAENLHNLRNSGYRTTTSSRVRSARTIMIVLLAYIVCFIGRISFIFVFLSSNKPLEWYLFLDHFCIFCGSICNSFIYGVRSTEFRNAWRETFKFNKKFKSKVHDSQIKAGKVFYINSAFGKKVVVIH